VATRDDDQTQAESAHGQGNPEPSFNEVIFIALDSFISSSFEDKVKGGAVAIVSSGDISNALMRHLTLISPIHGRAKGRKWSAPTVVVLDTAVLNFSRQSAHVHVKERVELNFTGEWFKKLLATDNSFISSSAYEPVKNFADPNYDRLLKDLTVRLTQVLEAERANTTAVDPLSAARERGLAFMRNQLELPENLRLADAERYTGRSGKHINKLRQAGRYYALVREGSARGYRYPSWQFDVDPARLEPILASLYDKALNGWSIHDFMMRHNDSLGQAPMKAIADPAFPLEKIEHAVQLRFHDSDQGAG
jgi:hypothetical protein